jgi:hypothetical protein
MALLDWTGSSTHGIGTGGHSIAGDFVRRTGVNSWNVLLFAGHAGMIGDAFIETRVGATGTYYMVGLAKAEPTVTTAVYADPNNSFAIYNASTDYRIYEGGAAVGFLSATHPAPVIGDVLRTEVVDGKARALINGVVVWEHAVDADDPEYFPYFVANNDGSTITDSKYAARTQLVDTWKRELRRPEHVRRPVATVVKVSWSGDSTVEGNQVVGFEGGYQPYYYTDSTEMIGIAGQFQALTGHMRTRLERVDPITYAIQPHSPSSIQRVQTRVTIADPDKELTRILEGRYNQRRAAIRIFWAFTEDESTTVSYPDDDGGVASTEEFYDWQPLFTGVVDKWERVGSSWVLTAHVDDFWLSGFAPKRGSSVGDWPDSVAEADGLRYPIYYGIHDGSNHSGSGFARAIIGSYDAGTPQSWFVASPGACQSIDRYFINGVERTVNKGVNYQYNAGGKIVTVPYFTTSAIPGVGDVVTLDLHGVTVNPTDETAALIMNPVAQLRHLITNFLHGDWINGASWLTETIIDKDSWNVAERFAALNSWEGTIAVGGDAKPQRIADVIGGWLESWQAFRLTWTPNGTLAIRTLPIEHPGYGDRDLFDTLFSDNERGATLATRMETERLTKSVSGSYLTDYASGKLWHSIEVQDMNVVEDLSLNVAHNHGLARLA